MRKPIILKLMPRARRDIERRVRFAARFSSGRPEERRQDIHEALQEIWRENDATDDESLPYRTV